jgi:hypothetical protein
MAVNYQVKTVINKIQAIQLEQNAEFFGKEITKGAWIVVDSGQGSIYSDTEFKEKFEPIPSISWPSGGGNRGWH